MTSYLLFVLLLIVVAERFKDQIAATVKKLVPKKQESTESLIINNRIDIIIDNQQKSHAMLAAELDYLKGGIQGVNQAQLATISLVKTISENQQANANQEVYLKSLELLSKASGTIIERQASIENILLTLTKELTGK